MNEWTKIQEQKTLAGSGKIFSTTIKNELNISDLEKGLYNLKLFEGTQEVYSTVIAKVK